MHMMKSE